MSSKPTEEQLRMADRIIKVVNAKLESRRDIIAQSLQHGSVIWRSDKGGKIEIDLRTRT